MSARTLRALAVLVWLVPGTAMFVSLLLAIWLRSVQWGGTGGLMVVLTIVGALGGDALANLARRKESFDQRVAAEVVRARNREINARNDAIERLERKCGIR